MPMVEAVEVGLPMATPVGLVGPDAPPPMAVPVMAFPEQPALDKDEQATMAVATALPEGWAGTAVVATVVAVPMERAVIGGKEMEGGEEGADEQTIVAVASAVPVYAAGTIEKLSQVMDDTFDDLRAIHGMLASAEQDAWRALFASLSPEQFGTIVGQVNLETAQPSTAELLARQLGGRMCSSYLLAALDRCSAQYKPQLVKAVAPMCASDLAANREAIESRLSEWEKILSRSALDDAAAGASV